VRSSTKRPATSISEERKRPTSKIAYLRVSTCEQKPDRQIDGLKMICDELHIETLSATARRRPVYERVMQRLRAGDVFVIWDLDRAYRSAKDALNELDRLRERGVDFLIANLDLDTTTPHGRLVYTIMGALAEFERATLSQRTKEGIAAARRRGRQLGRPPLLTVQQLRKADHRVARGEHIAAVARDFGVARWTLSRALHRHHDKQENP
jgi:DNA invertase Pin-like site-specific DNA recombinase